MTGLIELKLSGLNQLFNSMDPSPFHERDLDHDAEEFIVSWKENGLPPEDAESKQPGPKVTPVDRCSLRHLSRSSIFPCLPRLP
jgi:hypothetical protein